MKTRKLISKISFIFLLTLGTVATLQAQSTQSGGGWWHNGGNDEGNCVDCTSEINATASIVQQLACQGIQDLEFGMVGAGSNDQVSPNGGNESDENAGKFRIDGTSGSDVQVNLDFPDELSQLNGNETIPFSNGVGTWNSSDNQSGANALGTSGIVTLGGGGQAFIWVGGMITAANNQAAGDYSGTVTLEASYN